MFENWGVTVESVTEKHIRIFFFGNRIWIVYNKQILEESGGIIGYHKVPMITLYHKVSSYLEKCRACYFLILVFPNFDMPDFAPLIMLI